MVQQQALRDFAQAMANFFGGTHRKPTWRKAGRDEGFPISKLWAIHLSGPDEHRPLDAVVMTARRTKILRLVRLTEYPLASFWCTACNYACNADVNAARNIAAGHAVTAPGRRRDCPACEPPTSTACLLTGK